MALYFDTLCSKCKNVRKIENKRGSVFLMCRLHAEDRRYTKYPPQPVYRCKGFAAENAAENE